MDPVTSFAQPLLRVKRVSRVVEPEASGILGKSRPLQQQMKRTNNYRKMFAVSHLNPVVVIIATILLTIASQVHCRSVSDEPDGDGIAGDTINRRALDSSTVSTTTSALASNAVASVTPEHLAFLASEPRQYFKIHITPGAQRNSKRAALKEASSRRSSSSVSNTNPLSGSDSGNQNHHELHGKQKISNATLKKLLNQSLLKAANGSLAGAASPKASNFKFMFIQRAAPKSSSSNKDTNHHQKESTSFTKPPATTLATSVNPLESAHSTAASLAASVSKHLANTLLNSASDIVGNLSSVPSLTSLATQIVAQSLDQRNNHQTNGQKSSTSNSSSELEFNNLSDTKKIVTILKGVDTMMTKKNSSSSQGGKTKSKPPSKIYNLPVKFVANGQPNNHVVINAIRKHFATIKKLQTERQKFGGPAFEQNGAKRNKNKQIYKTKGNSRLIYLPLKYLSNAKPNKAIISKSVVKSS